MTKAIESEDTSAKTPESGIGFSDVFKGDNLSSFRSVDSKTQTALEASKGTLPSLEISRQDDAKQDSTIHSATKIGANDKTIADSLESKSLSELDFPNLRISDLQSSGRGGIALTDSASAYKRKAESGLQQGGDTNYGASLEARSSGRKIDSDAGLDPSIKDPKEIAAYLKKHAEKNIDYAKLWPDDKGKPDTEKTRVMTFGDVGHGDPTTKEEFTKAIREMANLKPPMKTVAFEFLPEKLSKDSGGESPTSKEFDKMNPDPEQRNLFSSEPGIIGAEAARIAGMQDQRFMYRIDSDNPVRKVDYLIHVPQKKRLPE